MGENQFFELSTMNKNYITEPISASEQAISLKLWSIKCLSHLPSKMNCTSLEKGKKKDQIPNHTHLGIGSFKLNLIESLERLQV